MVNPKICYYLFGLRIPIVLFLFVIVGFFRKQITTLSKNKILPYILISVPPLVIFIKILLNDPFFLSDDFDHILLSFHSGYLEIARKAISSEGIWLSHRIVAGFWLFKFIYEIFGANIYPFIFVMFLLQVINLFLLYRFMKFFVKNKILPVFFSFLFGFYYLSWNSNIHEVLGATFTLLTLIYAIRRIKSGKNELKYSLLCLSFYILAVFSKEITFLIFPTIVLLYIYKHELKKGIKFLAAMFVLFTLYAAFFATGFLKYFSFSAGYKMGFSFSAELGNFMKYLGMYAAPTGVFGILFFLLLAAGIVVSFRRSGWLCLVFIFGFLVLIFPALLFIDRTAPYYIYTPGLLLFTGLTKIFEDLFSVFSNYYLKAAILIFCLFFIFDVDIKLRDNCFLIVSPWPKLEKTEFLSLISSVKDFENGVGVERMRVFSVGEKADGLLIQYLNEGQPEDLVKAFLYPAGGGYNYTYNRGKRELVVNKNG